MKNEMIEPIYTNRLMLRQIIMEDAEALFSYRCHQDIKKYQSWQPSTMDDVNNFIVKTKDIKVNEDGKWLQLAICLQQSGELIGDFGIHFLSDDSYQVEIGYTISPVYQGKGYATEAVRGVLDVLFKKYNKHRVIASVDPENIRSIGLLEKIGMRKEAHFIKSILIRDQWMDDCIYAILREEWDSE